MSPHLRLTLFAPIVLTLATFAGGQTTAPVTQTTQTTQTPGYPASSTTTTTTTNGALTKKQMKQQRKQQKLAEKAANQNYQAQKDQANALKHQDKATNDQEKLNQSAPPPPPPQQ